MSTNRTIFALLLALFALGLCASSAWAGIRQFVRYYNPRTGDHWATTGGVGLNYVREGSLGSIFASAGDTFYATRPLFGCERNGDHMISLRGDCEGYRRLGTEGWILIASSFQYAQTRPIYRCLRILPGNRMDHYVSLRADCEGAGRNEGRLGFTIW